LAGRTIKASGLPDKEVGTKKSRKPPSFVKAIRDKEREKRRQDAGVTNPVPLAIARQAGTMSKGWLREANEGDWPAYPFFVRVKRRPLQNKHPCGVKSLTSEEVSYIKDNAKRWTTVFEGKKKKFGGRGGARTPGLIVANDALSQLSYTPVPQLN
jgi:hypothetical protein